MNVFGQLTGALSAPQTLQGSLTIPASATFMYDGEYEFTPSTETQVIEIEQLTARQNITINPIPQNYGLITYNGSTITVS